MKLFKNSLKTLNEMIANFCELLQVYLSALTFLQVLLHQYPPQALRFPCPQDHLRLLMLLLLPPPAQVCC